MPALHRETTWAKETLLGDLRQSVPHNGRVHLLGINVCSVFEGRGMYFQHVGVDGASPESVPEGLERHLDAARQNCRETISAA